MSGDRFIDIFESFLNRKIETEVAESFKTAFVKKFLNEAYRNPNGKASLFLADSILKGDISGADREADPELALFKIRRQCFRRQREVLDNAKDDRRLVLMTSRRAGKTETLCRMMVGACVFRDSPVLYIGLTLTDAVSQVFDNSMKIAAAVGLKVKRASASSGRIEFENGSAISIGGNRTIRDQESYRGFKNRLVIIDEAQSQRFLPNLIDNILMPTLADFSDGVFVLSGTPPRVKKTYFEQALNSESWSRYHWTAAENPFIPDWRKSISEICEAKGLPETAPFIQREYFGRISYDTEALIFNGFKTYEPTILSGVFSEGSVGDPARLSDGIVYEFSADFIPSEIYIGVDWGFSDKFAVIGAVFSTAKRMAKVFFEAKASRKTASEMFAVILSAYKEAEKIQSGNPTVNYIEIYADTNEGALLSELVSQYGLPAHKSYKVDKDAHIELLADVCRSGALLIPSGGILEDEFERTVHPRNASGEMLRGIDDDAFHPDAVDALLYACRRWLSESGQGGRFKEADRDF